MEDPEKKEAEAEVTSPSPEKLVIDNPADFQFHAAYLAYSEAFDKRTEPKIRVELNESLEALRKNEIDYPAFYRTVNQYRGGIGSEQGGHSGLFLKTQRKKDWRRSTQKSERIKRHKK
jgi:hypothetical protein